MIDDGVFQVSRDHAMYPVIVATCIAVDAHAAQTDKAGKPYLLHVLRVASEMDTVDEAVVGLLHDVLEDSREWTPERLDQFFPAHIVTAVVAVTKAPVEDYMSYIKQLSRNPVARKVKIADLRHNMDLSRLANVTDEDVERAEKYRVALTYLSAT